MDVKQWLNDVSSGATIKVQKSWELKINKWVEQIREWMFCWMSFFGINFFLDFPNWVKSQIVTPTLKKVILPK